jgi:hypothetical protein
MRVWVEPSALDEIAALPSHMRQRMRRAVSDLRERPRPSQSRPLEIPDDVQHANQSALSDKLLTRTTDHARPTPDRGRRGPAISPRAAGG